MVDWRAINLFYSGKANPDFKLISMEDQSWITDTLKKYKFDDSDRLT